MKHGLMFVLIVLLGCSNNEPIPELGLEGKWVEVNTLTDTLEFSLLDDQELMVLSRGTENRDGFILPKPGSGSYDYHLQKDKISLRSHLSSNSSFVDYHFNLSGDKMIIGNFYEPNSQGTKQTFQKLK